ncbi:MAG: uracil-DNA glycosylase [Veillonella sp.]|nr:uracil-DNA glycosylase [Veillonella sp.]
MSLFAPEEEKTLSFDEYIASFDTNQIAKVQQFVDWLGQYRGELVHNPLGEVNTALEIVRSGFDAAQVRRNNLMAYLLPRLGRSKIFMVAEAVGYQGGRFSGIAITCERMLLDKHKTIRAHQITPVTLQRTSSPLSPMLKRTQQEPLTNRTPTESEQQLGWEYTKRLLALHTELGGPKPLVLAVGQKSADTMGRFGLSAIGLRHPANGGANLYREGFAKAIGQSIW